MSGSCFARGSDPQGSLKSMLTCVGCLKLMEPPIFSCPSISHSYCEPCKLKLVNCQYCKKPIGPRNTLLENQTKDLIYNCEYPGCNEMYQLGMRHGHQVNCPYRPVECHGSCSWQGPVHRLLDHIDCHVGNLRTDEFTVASFEYGRAMNVSHFRVHSEGLMFDYIKVGPDSSMFVLEVVRQREKVFLCLVHYGLFCLTSLCVYTVRLHSCDNTSCVIFENRPVVHDSAYDPGSSGIELPPHDWMVRSGYTDKEHKINFDIRIDHTGHYYPLRD